MKKSVFLAVTGLALSIGLTGCVLNEEQSDKIPVEAVNEKPKPAPQRPKPRPAQKPQAVEEEPALENETVIDQAFGDQNALQGKRTLPDGTVAEVDGVTGAYVPSYDENSDGQELPPHSPEDAMPEPPKDETLDEVKQMPDFASSSNLNSSCKPSLNEAVQKNSELLAKELSARLNVAPGDIFVANTVIPDELLDCIKDSSGAVKRGFTSESKFTVNESLKSTADGRATIVPQIMRIARQEKIPYLAVTVIKKVAGKFRVTMRVLRVVDGITLTQNYKNLE
ncbi:MAG TPA: hypothetical protein DCR21_07180 [Succinivibrionaceae bacterium]|nr:hypothetical protein [Succinivibrionaceae bacterium]